MGQGSIIGYEINEKTCQISFYNDREMEPDTLEVDSDNFQIPLIIGKLRDTWAYGKEAKRLVSIKEGFTVTRLLSRSLAGETVEFGEETYDAVWLLSRFIQMSLQSFPEIEGIVFTVPSLTEELAQLLRGIAVRMNIDKRHIFIQDYKESFCNYLFYQPKELWQYDAALFCCDRNEIKAYMLRRLKPGLDGGKTTFVTVDEVASAHMKELAMVYPVLNEDKAKEADAMFCRFIESVFDKPCHPCSSPEKALKTTGIPGRCACSATAGGRLSGIICTVRARAIPHTENSLCISRIRCICRKAS